MTRMMIPFVMLLAACGIGDSKTLVDLDADDALKLCQEFSTDASTITCDGVDIDIDASDDALCATGIGETPTACAATAGDFRACAEAFEALDPCEPLTDIPAACSPLFVEACLPSAE